jgi:preprotein translocase subunit SecG
MLLTYLITTIHVIVCAILIIVVLLQHGKSADIAATFGGAGSQTAFGPRGTATLLSKITTWSAILFMVTSISLTIFAGNSKGRTRSATEGLQTAPTAPAQKSPAPPAPAK